MIITIDGPAGSGKSTAARKLAAMLSMPYLDTGAMYRAIAFAARQRGVDFDDADALLVVAESIEMQLECGPTHTRVRIDGQDVSEGIRSMAVNQVTSLVAKVQPIRDLLVGKQREIGKALQSFVTEGRDQGSVVFPDADVRFVLDASLDTRARRRHAEMSSDGDAVDLEAVRANLKRRDQIDSKQWAPLMEPGQAIIIDTTDMELDEVVDRLAAEVRSPRGV